ncbi:hypothetical protein EVAR_69114_1 [Eumeta japonica]|uniref:Uncharacterized protein n=1 Tax=Eumeta variegata TaxID=151549 RepID=A0A4C1SN03_EUMVA|nr:hypothetical protein EVAR_69114_1 [Eumeta japonica]
MSDDEIIVHSVLKFQPYHLDRDALKAASNAAGSDTARVTLEVDEPPTGDDPPTFLRRLQDLTVKVGTRTRFLVEITSSTECKKVRGDKRLCCLSSSVGNEKICGFAHREKKSGVRVGDEDRERGGRVGRGVRGRSRAKVKVRDSVKICNYNRLVVI